MASTVGFATNASAATGINTGYVLAKGILLASVSSTTGAETPFTAGCYFDNLELECTPTGAVTTVTARLTWDAAGDHPASAEGTITLLQGITTTTLWGGVVVMDAWKRPPSTQAAVGTVYLWLKTNANTIDVAAGGAKLHWTDGFARS